MHPITDTSKLTPLWDRTRATFARAIAAVGGPASIAAIALLTKTLRRDIIRWLAPLENIVRKLLYAQAAALAATPQQRCTTRCVTIPVSSLGLARHYSAAMAEAQRHAAMPANACADPRPSRQRDLSQPQSWPARFSFALPRDPRRVPEASAPRIRALWGSPPPPPPSPRVINREAAAFRLARRFEALRRVLHDPMPHARRLAALITRAVRRFPELLYRYAVQPARAHGADPDDPRLAIDAIGSALNAPLAFHNSS